MDIYRSDRGRTAVRASCTGELDRRLPVAYRRVVNSPLGPTHLTTSGTGPTSNRGRRRDPEDTFVLPSLLSACRDPRAHAEPDRFDLNRGGIGGGSQLAFGHGVHFCLGAPLARLETRIALEEILTRYRTLDVVPDTEHRPYPRAVLGARTLPVTARS